MMMQQMQIMKKNKKRFQETRTSSVKGEYMEKQKLRNEIEEKYTWDLTPIFKTKDVPSDDKTLTCEKSPSAAVVTMNASFIEISLLS